jgi:hypothetical protein
MAERLLPLPVTQAARVLLPVPARPMISVEKLALFCNSIINRSKFAVAKAKVFPHLEAWFLVGRGIPHVKGYNGTCTTASLFQRIQAFKKQLCK